MMTHDLKQLEQRDYDINFGAKVSAVVLWLRNDFKVSEVR